MNTDWQTVINDAVAKGDYVTAAKAEQNRNEKINSMNAAGGGTNKYGATATNNYSVWLPQNAPAGYGGSASNIGTYTSDQEALKAQMNQNSKDWYTATTQEQKDSLHAHNQYLAGLLGGDVTFNSANGSWSGAAAQPTVFPSFSYDEERPTYDDNGMSARIDEMLNKILNRDAFSYNAAEDDLYKQYASMYQREGNRAMNDALASAAATAGGMNSYAMTAANQANNYYMAQLGDKIPELYQLAYDMYLKDIDNQVRDLGLLEGMDDKQYSRYRDTMGDWENDRNFAYQQYLGDFDKYRWQKEFDTGNQQWQDSFDASNDQWQQSFDASNDHWQKEFDFETGQETGNTAYAKAMELLNAGAMPDAEMLKAAGMTEQQASTILAAVKAEQLGLVDPTVSTTGSPSDEPKGNPGGGYNNGSLTTSQIKELQRYYGVSADGLWGNNSKSAAGGKSADAAWKEYVKNVKNGDNYDADPDEPTATDGELFNAKANLGIGAMVSDDLIWQLMQFNGVIEKDGKFVWANGWDKNNWQEKYNAAIKNGGIGLYAGVGVH